MHFRASSIRKNVVKLINKDIVKEKLEKKTEIQKLRKESKARRKENWRIRRERTKNYFSNTLLRIKTKIKRNK